MTKTRAEALALLLEYTQNPGLIKHGLAVEAALRAYARKLGQDEDTWGIVGLLHDFDYERWPDPPDHPLQGAAILQQRGYPEEVIYAIKSHADYLTDCPRIHLLDKALYACDELPGLIHATALLRPTGIGDLTAASVKKKMKARGFARGVKREDVERGAADFGVDLTDHIQFVIDAMKSIAPELGLAPGSAEPASRTEVARPETVMLQYGLKEWAAVVEALARGRQALLLRKGGIEEESGEFRPEHRRFWLYPTYLHETREGLKPDAGPLLEEAVARRPPEGTVQLTHFAEVTGVYEAHDLVGVLRLDPLHVWSEETVQARFAYRRPGLWVLAVRVYRAAEPVEIQETGAQAGCKSWVPLETVVPVDGATPVLDDDAYRDYQRTLELLLQPSAMA